MSRRQRTGTQRAYANQLRNSATTNFLRRQQLDKRETQVQECITIEAVELYLAQNAESHHTERFEIANESLVLRRGTPFYIALRANRDFDPAVDTVKIVMDFGPTPSVPKGTKNVLPLETGATVQSQPGRWDAVISSHEGRNIVVMIEAPVTCQIGIWHCTIVTGLQQRPQQVFEKKIEEDFYMLFNPWCSGDLTYMSDEKERNEYVLNDTGKVWMGSYRQPMGRRWVFGQYEDAVLPCVMYLLELSDLPHEDRGNPVYMARAISAIINANDEGGLVIGRWDNNYSDGTSPHIWTGSVAIMEEYLKSGAEPVAYAQCWVFSALTVTVCRALGLPCRSVTNYVSAHDTNSSLTIDKYFNSAGEVIDGGPDGTCYDSCWNFHVWNDVWMSRPDLGSGYGGWQIIDATPQEMSGNMMRCGPASLEAVKNGKVAANYDTAFVFSEVNADVCHFVENHRSIWGFSRSKINQYHVGRKIVTKKVGVDDDVNDSDMWDVTSHYKNEEGSKEERMAVFNAVRGVDKAKLHYDISDETVDDVALDMIEIDAIQFGEPFSVVVKIQNKSPQVRTIDAVLSANSVFYTGVIVHRLKCSSGQFRLMPYAEDTIRLDVTPQEYESKLVDHSLIKIHAIATVLETKHTWSEEDDFPLIKPQLAIQLDGNIQVGQPCTARFAFKNPLDRPLTNVSISVEGPGLQRAKIVKCPNVGPRDEFSYVESFHPRRAGERKFVAAFSSNELSDVSGSVGVRVEP